MALAPKFRQMPLTVPHRQPLLFVAAEPPDGALPPRAGDSGARGFRLRRSADAILAAFTRQALHAEQLEFEHPASGEPVAWKVDPPSDLRALFGATPITFVIGVYADKDVRGILDALIPLAARVIFTRAPS